MPKIRLVKVIFDTKLTPIEIPAFRGAIIQIVGQEHVAFHHHIGDERFHYSYPVIQYKTHGKKAGIVCIQDGVDEIHHFFSKNEGQIRLGNEWRPLHVESVKINQFQVQVWDTSFAYSIRKWLPLNEKNYMVYQSLENLQERIVFLEKIIIGNVLSFAKGIGWTVDKPIEAKILDLSRQYWVSHKGVKLQAFDLDFKINAFLPFDVGLGKGASMGFGTLYRQQKTKYSQ